MGNVVVRFHRTCLHANAIDLLEVWRANSGEQALSSQFLTRFSQCNEQDSKNSFSSVIVIYSEGALELEAIVTKYLASVPQMWTSDVYAKPIEQHPCSPRSLELVLAIMILFITLSL